MINDLRVMFNTFSSQSDFIKKIISINYFYLFIVGLGDVFIYVMIYDITRDLKSLIIYNFIRVSGAIFAFISNYFLLKIRYSIKNIYRYFVFMLFIAFIVLNFSFNETYMFYIFGSLYGFAIGLFWFSHHNYTLDNLKFEDRDFFSSMISFGKEIFTIIVPLTAVISFYISDVLFKTNTYTLLFAILLLSSVIMLFSVKSMKSLKPKYVNPIFAFKKLSNHVSGRDFYGYNIMRAIISTFTMVFIGFVGIEAVKTPINVGIIEFITGLISILLVSKFSASKYSSKRIDLMFISVIITGLAYFMLIVFNISAFGYLLFSLLLILANPFLSTVRTITDMHSIDILKVSNSHSLGIFYREVALYFGRMISFGLSMTILYFFDGDIFIISSLFSFVIVISSFFQYVFAKNIYSRIA